jgi:hypothetical protein
MRTLVEIDAERAQVLEQKAELEAEADHIKLRLAAAKSKVRSEGEYSDSDWWYQANDDLRIKKKEVRALARRLSELKAERSKVGRALHLARASSTDSDVKKEVTAILFRIAKLARDRLTGEEDKDCEELDNLLSELSRLRPDWHRRTS